MHRICEQLHHVACELTSDPRAHSPAFTYETTGDQSEEEAKLDNEDSQEHKYWMTPKCLDFNAELCFQLSEIIRRLFN